MTNFNFMKRLFFLFSFFLVLGGSIQAQKNEVLSNMELGNYPTEWKLYKSVQFIDIYYKYSDCSDPSNGFYPEYILFKVKNKTDKKIYTYWEYTANYDDKPSMASPDENLVQVKLQPNEVIEGTCANYHKTRLGIFVRLKNRQNLGLLTNFDLNEIKEFKLN